MHYFSRTEDIMSTSAVIKKRQIVGITAAVILLAAMFFIPATELLPPAARNMLCVMLAVIVMLVTEVFPLGITCLLGIAMMYFFRCVDSVPAGLTGFTNATLFFVLASFGISKALTVVPVSKRLLLFLMRKFGKNINRLLFAIMLVTALLSSVISNVAAAAVFIPIITQFLTVYDNEEDRKKTARAYMIALPVASMIGGMMTPAGSSINMLAISMLEKYAGTTIPFVKWMIMGIPLTVVLLPVAWFLCVKVFKPAPLSREKINSYIDRVMTEIPGKMTGKEKYVLVILFAMLVLWIISSWVPVLNITAVALVGLMLYFLPGKMQILTWKDFTSSVSLEAFLLMGTMISMGSVISSSGLSGWISAVIFPASLNTATPLFLMFVAVITFVLLIPIPVAPALITMLASPLILLAQGSGVSPALTMAVFGLCACNCYLLPLDTVPLMTYATGAYDMFDMPKATAAVQVVMIVLSSLWLSVCGRLL